MSKPKRKIKHKSKPAPQRQITIHDDNIWLRGNKNFPNKPEKFDGANVTADQLQAILQDIKLHFDLAITSAKIKLSDFDLDIKLGKKNNIYIVLGHWILWDSAGTEYLSYFDNDNTFTFYKFLLSKIVGLLNIFTVLAKELELTYIETDDGDEAEYSEVNENGVEKKIEDIVPLSDESLKPPKEPSGKLIKESGKQIKG